MRDEEWKAVPGHEGFYEASDLGRIRSVDRVQEFERVRLGVRQSFTRKLKGTVRKLSTSGRGYLRVSIAKDGKHETKDVHQLVAAAFLGPCPEGMQCCHNNGDKTDNRPSNLRYDTPKANVADAKRHGTRVAGSDHHKAKLAEDDIPKIRAMIEAGESNARIAEKYPVTPGAIWHIRRSLSWNHV